MKRSAMQSPSKSNMLTLWGDVKIGYWIWLWIPPQFWFTKVSLKFEISYIPVSLLYKATFNLPFDE